MTDAERLEALANLFIAGAAVPDGARKLIGFLLVSERWPYRRHDVGLVYSAGETTVSRWIKEARQIGVLKKPLKQGYLDLQDIDTDRLRELAEPAP